MYRIFLRPKEEIVLASKIYKHELTVGEQTKINCASVLSVIEQDGKVMLYAIDNPNYNKPHFFYVVGTGWDLDRCESMSFLGTVKCGVFVWHVFHRGVAV